MKLRTRLLAVALLLAAQAFHRAHAQETNAQPAQPKTKGEAFQATSGAVIIAASSQVGSVKGNNYTLVEVECKELTDAASRHKEYGITLEVALTDPLKTQSVSVIDYDEIDSLLKGIDYIAKIDKSTTKLADFQASYKTKGGLVVSTYNTPRGSIEAAVTGGGLGGTWARLSLADLQELRRLIAKSKEMLDDIRKETPPPHAHKSPEPTSVGPFTPAFAVLLTSPTWHSSRS